MLALKYRPTSFHDVIGQKEASVFLAHMTSKRDLPNLMIFDGVHGSGKTSTARIIGAAVNCPNFVAPDPCGECESCKDIFDGVSMAVTEIDAASHGKVADMEKLREDLLYSSIADLKVVILDEAHAISREGFKSMLKTFEEAPPGVRFILITTEFRRIPETIVSRSMRFTFHRVPVVDIISRLEHVNLMEDLQFDEPLIHYIAQKANGVLRDALMLLDKISRSTIKTLKEYQSVTGERDFAPILLTAMINSGPAAALKVVDDELKSSGDPESVPEGLMYLFRDLLLIRSGMPVAWQGEALETRQRLASHVTPLQIMNSQRVLWDLKTKFRHSESYYEVHLAVTMISELFAGKETPTVAAKPPTPARAPVKASLQELSNI